MPATSWQVIKPLKANAAKASAAATRVKKALVAKKALRVHAARKARKALAVRKALRVLAARKARKALAVRKVKKVHAAVRPEIEPMSQRIYPVSGAGLGLRRALLGPLRSYDAEILGSQVSFMEVDCELEEYWQVKPASEIDNIKT